MSNTLRLRDPPPPCSLGSSLFFNSLLTPTPGCVPRGQVVGSVEDDVGARLLQGRARVCGRGDRDDRQTAMRGGLAWLDLECQDRYDKTFLDCAPGERTAVLDDIAWPRRAQPEFSQGVAFFNSFRDLTAGGFFSSKMGVEDLKYLGNMMNPNWSGCPEEALKKLGV